MASVRKHINIFGESKYQLYRQKLGKKLYLVFIRPISEYASEVWNNCRSDYANQLEKLHLDAARIVTGLPTFTRTDSFYMESGRQSLTERSKRRKLHTSFNMMHDNASDF